MIYFYNDENVTMPYNRLKTLYNAGSYLKPGIRFEIPERLACEINNKPAMGL